MDMANKDIDWYTIPMEQVFEKLECSMEGLTSEIVVKRLALFGPNNIKNDTFKWSRILRSCWRNFWSPQVLATIIWGAIQWNKGLNSVVGLVPTCFILTLSLMVFNDLIDKYLHSKISERIAPFARKVEVLRDGMWSKEEASGLVPGDVIMIKAGDVVPADCRLLEGDALLIDQCALTGESSGVMKTESDVVYSGSICEQGESRAVIVATGGSIFFRKEAHQAKKDIYLDKVLTTIEKFSKWLVVIGISVEIIVMYGIQHREIRAVFGNLLVLIIVGIPINFRLAILSSISGGFEESAKGTILKRLLRVKEVADMEVVCYDASLGTLTQNKPTILYDLIEVLAEGVDAEMVGSMADRACRTKNHSDHTTSEIYFCNLKDDDKVYNVCIGPSEKILSLAHNKEEIEGKVKSFSDKFRNSGFKSMAVAYQEVTDGEDLKDGDSEIQWELIGVVPVFNSPKCDSIDFITRASDLGIDVKIFTADPLEIAKETSRSLGKGTNIYPSFSMLRQIKDVRDCDSSVVNLIGKADGFSDVLPGHMHAIIEQLQSRKHVCAMIGKSVSDYNAMKKADIGVADLNACDAAREASDLLLTQPNPDVLLRCLLTSRKISHATKIYSIHAIASRLYSVLGLLLLALIWKFDFPPQVLFILLIFHEVFTIRHELFYKVKPSAPPDRWRLTEVLKTGTTLGVSSVVMTLLFFWAVNNPNVFQRAFGVASLKDGDEFDYGRLLPLMSIHVTMSRNTITLLAQSPHQSGVTLSRLLYVFILILFPMLAFTMPLAYDLEHDYRDLLGSKSYWGWVAITWLCNIVSYIVLLLLKFFIQRIKEYKSQQIK